ncbi:MAG: MgtC/SapB family protein [Salinigranum sp.]
MAISLQAGGLAFDSPEIIVRLVLAAALGLFLGLEREWSEKSAGVRTFSLTGLLGGATALLALRTSLGTVLLALRTSLGTVLLALGGALVLVQAVLLAVQGLRETPRTLSLTTSVALMVAYGVGALVVAGFVIEGVTVAVLAALLLVEKRELHTFAGGLTQEELQSTAEFAILAFVVYPLLPAEPVTVLGAPVEPRVAWLMVVTVAGIGIVNYAIVQTYGGRGVAVTGFFGGLASSTAVVGTMLDHVRQSPAALSYAAAGVLLADAAMAFRNLLIVLAFTFQAGVLAGAVLPLGTLVVGGIAVAALGADWRERVDLSIESPFSLRNALAFGLTFLVVLVVGTIAQDRFGTAGLYLSSFLSGLVSSAGATTTAVLLYRGGTITGATTVSAVLLASAASVLVKAGLALAGPRDFFRRVAAWSVALVVCAGLATLAVVAFG